MRVSRWRLSPETHLPIYMLGPIHGKSSLWNDGEWVQHQSLEKYKFATHFERAEFEFSQARMTQSDKYHGLEAARPEAAQEIDIFEGPSKRGYLLSGLPPRYEGLGPTTRSYNPIEA
jgi:hypothetical protein